jgi:hypothetical protein
MQLRGTGDRGGMGGSTKSVKGCFQLYFRNTNKMPSHPQDVDVDKLVQERQNKVTEYENFIDTVLRADLKLILDQRDKIYDQISQ